VLAPDITTLDRQTGHLLAIRRSNVEKMPMLRKMPCGGIITAPAGLATGMTGALTTTRQDASVVASNGLSTLSGGMAPSVQMLAPHGRHRETDGTLTCMTAFVAFLVERLHVDLGHVSSAVCMAG
jgi:hypothetical protein